MPTVGKGRKKVPKEVARAIQDRLRDFLRSRYGSLYAFLEGYPASEVLGSRKWRSTVRREATLSRKTVAGWFQPGRVPDAASVLQLAEHARLSPSFLLLGEGDPLRGVTSPPRALGAAVRRKLVEELRVDGYSPAFIDGFLPDPEDIVAEIVGWYGQRARIDDDEFRKRFGDLTVESAQRWYMHLGDFLRTRGLPVRENAGRGAGPSRPDDGESEPREVV